MHQRPKVKNVQVMVTAGRTVPDEVEIGIGVEGGKGPKEARNHQKNSPLKEIHASERQLVDGRRCCEIESRNLRGG